MPIIASWIADLCIAVWSLVGAFAIIFGLLASLSKSRKFVSDAVSEALKDPIV